MTQLLSVLQGYAVVTILPNDLSNGKIGFSEDSKLVTVNEDLTPIFNLKLARTEAYFGEVEVRHDVCYYENKSMQ